jgi:hypothetical protein
VSPTVPAALDAGSGDPSAEVTHPTSSVEHSAANAIVGVRNAATTAAATAVPRILPDVRALMCIVTDPPSGNRAGTRL